MFTIKAASEITDVPVATLRAWERRYGIAEPIRTEHGYRLYDERALGELRAMRTLLASGWAARQAAEEVIRRRAVTGVPAFDALAQQHAGLPGPESLVDAARRLDETAVTAVLDAALTGASFEHVLDAWLSPALHLFGDAWRAGTLDITAEHLVSAAVMRRLASLYEAAGAGQQGPRILVGLPAGSEHEIPALAFAVCARRAGLMTTYLGPNIPAHAWASAVRATPAAAVVLVAVTGFDAAAATAAVDAIRTERPDVCVAVGGSAAAAVANASLTLNDSIPQSARVLADTIARPTIRK